MACRVLALLSLAAPLVSCEYDAGLAPPIKPRLVVHAVLNPLAAEQVILVEQTRAVGDGGNGGGVGLPDEFAGDSLEPIRSRGGLPISGASVVLFGPDGDSAVAAEDAATRPDGAGAGVYRVGNSTLGAAGIAIRSGSTYRLRVRAELGTATGETTVPGGPPFARPDTCTSRLDVWAATSGYTAPTAVSPGTSVYVARTDAHDGAAMFFTAGPPRITISGAGPRVFVQSTGPQGSTRLRAIAWALPPGFRQTISVAAVDTNFRNYYGDLIEDPFGSDTRASSIRGGVGLFGSAVLLGARTIELFSSAEETIVGRYALEGLNPGLPERIDLYVNAPWGSTPDDSLRAFSGRFQYADGRAGGITGSVLSSSVSLTLHDGRTAPALRRPLLALGGASFDGQRIRAFVGAQEVVYAKVGTSLRPSPGTCRF